MRYFLPVISLTILISVSMVVFPANATSQDIDFSSIEYTVHNISSEGEKINVPVPEDL
jgi:hypothetical protein